MANLPLGPKSKVSRSLEHFAGFKVPGLVQISGHPAQGGRTVFVK